MVDFHWCNRRPFPGSVAAKVVTDVVALGNVPSLVRAIARRLGGVMSCQWPPPVSLAVNCTIFLSQGVEVPFQPPQVKKAFEVGSFQMACPFNIYGLISGLFSS